ncbi:multidrug ABC transporter ATP-binding protein, partial [Mycoplasmopsis pullorum]
MNILQIKNLSKIYRNKTKESGIFNLNFN